MSKQIEYADLCDIFLDSMNPRLGGAAQERGLTQEEVYEHMRGWSLEELATSFLESGFWVHEAVLCLVEEIHGEERPIVIEGNRRIAALMRLKKTYEGAERSPKWLQLIDGVAEPTGMFAAIPYGWFRWLRWARRSRTALFSARIRYIVALRTQIDALVQQRRVHFRGARSAKRGEHSTSRTSLRSASLRARAGAGRGCRCPVFGLRRR